MELIYLAMIMLFFALTWGLPKLCGVLGGGR